MAPRRVTGFSADQSVTERAHVVVLPRRQTRPRSRRGVRNLACKQHPCKAEKAIPLSELLRRYNLRTLGSNNCIGKQACEEEEEEDMPVLDIPIPSFRVDIPIPSFRMEKPQKEQQADWTILASTVGSGFIDGFLTEEDRAAAAAGAFLSRLRPCASLRPVDQVPNGRNIPIPQFGKVLSPESEALANEVDWSILQSKVGSDCAGFLTAEDRAAAAAASLLARISASATGGGDARTAQVTAAPLAKRVPGPRFLTSSRDSRVKFALDAVTTHAVIPYSEIYGRHPREFVFDRDSCMVPAAFGGFVSEGSTADDDEDSSDTDTEGEDAIMDGWDSFLQSAWRLDDTSDELDDTRTCKSRVQSRSSC